VHRKHFAQTYQNWDCTIINNCSTIDRGDRRRRYIAKDSRIRLQEKKILRVIPNHNVALRQISSRASTAKWYCGRLLFPRCLEEMVSLAEEYPSAGIVGAYGLQGHGGYVGGTAIP